MRQRLYSCGLTVYGLILFSASMAYMLFARSTDDIVLYGSIFTAFFYALALVDTAPELRATFRDHPARPAGQTARALFASLATLSISLVVSMGWALTAYGLLSAILDAIWKVASWAKQFHLHQKPSMPMILAATAVAFLAAVALLEFRNRFRSTYGVTEMLLGLYVAVNKFSNIGQIENAASRDLLIGVLTASVYLMVRGIDDIKLGFHEDPLFLYLFAKHPLPDSENDSASEKIPPNDDPASSPPAR